MLTDTELICALLGNVLKGIVDLSRQTIHTDYIWKQKISNHFLQFYQYTVNLYIFDVRPNIHVDGSFLPYEIVSIEKSEEDSNLYLIVSDCHDRLVTFPFSQILDLKVVLPASRYMFTYSNK